MNWRRQNPAVDDADSALAPTLLPGQGAVAAPSIPSPPPAADETQATMLRWFEDAPTRGERTIDLRDRSYPPPPPPSDVPGWMAGPMPPPPPGQEPSDSWFAGPTAPPADPEAIAASWYAPATTPPAPAAGWFAGESAGGTATPSPTLPIVNAAEATALDPVGPAVVADPVAAASQAPATMAIPLPGDGHGGPGKIVLLDLHGDHPPGHAPVRVLGQGGPNSPAMGIDASGDIKVEGWPAGAGPTAPSPARRIVTMVLVLLGVIAGGAVVRSAMNSSEPIKVFGVPLHVGNAAPSPSVGVTSAPASVPSVSITSVVTKNGTRSTIVQVVPGKTTKSTTTSKPASPTTAPATPTSKSTTSPPASTTTTPPPTTTTTTPPPTTTTTTPPPTTTTATPPPTTPAPAPTVTPLPTAALG